MKIVEGNYYSWKDVCKQLCGCEIIVADRQFKDGEFYFKLLKICNPKVDFTWHECNLMAEYYEDVSYYYVKDNLGVDNDMCVVYDIKDYNNITYKVKSMSDLINNHRRGLAIACDSYRDEVAEFVTVLEIRETCEMIEINDIYKKYNAKLYPLVIE